MLTLGLVGLGAIHEHHARALERTHGVRVTAAVDVDPSRRPGLPVDARLSDHRELIRRGLAEAVVVATPTARHFEVARDCLEAGLHVLLEKPACLGRAELEALYAEADRAGVRLVVAFHDVFGDEVVRLREGLWDELVERRGPPEAVLLSFADPYAVPGARDRRESLVGSWVDNGSNALSVASSLVGPVEVRRAAFRAATGSRADAGDDGADVHLEACRTPGLRVRIRTRWTRRRKRKVTALSFADGSRVVVNHLERCVADNAGAELFRATSAVPRLASQYARVFPAFVQAVREGSDNRRFTWSVHEPLFAALEGRAAT